MTGALIALAILFAATPTPAPVRVTLNDLVGMWVTVRGDCSRGQHLLAENGKYKMWCFDSISEGAWFLRGGNKIILRHDPKTADGEIIAVACFERYFDQTFLYVRYQEGRRDSGDEAMDQAKSNWNRHRCICHDTLPRLISFLLDLK